MATPGADAFGQQRSEHAREDYRHWQTVGDQGLIRWIPVKVRRPEPGEKKTQKENIQTEPGGRLQCPLPLLQSKQAKQAHGNEG